MLLFAVIIAVTCAIYIDEPPLFKACQEDFAILRHTILEMIQLLLPIQGISLPLSAHLSAIFLP